MTSYTVYKIMTVGTRQLLIVSDATGVDYNLCVYDEHTGTTLKRMTKPTVAEFRHALDILDSTE